MKRSLRAFTLIEIMIVVMIMAILIAIATPNFVTARENSRTKTCISSLKQIDGAKEQWAMDNKKTNGDVSVWADLTPTYIRVQPVCPNSGTYTVGAIGALPTCTVAAHVLP